MKALLLGYYGARNLGDDMMLYCLLRWFERQSIKVTVVSEAPEETGDRFSVPVIRNAPLLGEWACWDSWFHGHASALVRAIRDHEALIVGGGDLIRDDKGWKIFWYTIEKIVVALLLGKKVFLVNIGIGEPRTSWGKCVLSFIFRRCKKIIVRDERSLRVCMERCGKNNYVEKPDIVTSLPSFLEKVVAKRMHDSAPYILVCLRKEPNDFGTYPFGNREIDALAKALDQIIVCKKTKVFFVPFQTGSSNDDNLLHKRIFDRMEQKEMANIRDWTSNLGILSELFRGASCIVAMRLHAAVLGVAYERPVVVMPYDRKVTEFADLVGINSRIESMKAADDDYMSNLIDKEIDGNKTKYSIESRDWDSFYLSEKTN